MPSITNARNFVQECVVEMEKVTWPDRDQLRNATWVVILFTILISLVIWIMDTISRLVIVDFIMGVFRS
ncbi:MAG: preprotein translocase subunit SecE [Gemmatimonadetes bacterium]|nr:preprotein translocase subunit SecE [Gemmatimonadota bacterium]MCY3612991.1 preprotein translocase subunit SecE [Gemmatimonadota bacterium]MCY3676869.1 preprotein translocase subunit SecE [Gemmatimonadota bacterium]MDE2805173.1 preprotein translocase subunit SecE [Gemmatimonadota bacterium]MYA40833.1 preprotein translocase subunit SecE [Gemmatimonadota bacterium]